MNKNDSFSLTSSNILEESIIISVISIEESYKIKIIDKHLENNFKINEKSKKWIKIKDRKA